MRVAPVSSRIQEALLAQSEFRVEPAGIVLFRRGEAAFGIFLVQTGSVSLRLEGDGEATILDRIADPGSIVGLPGTLSGPSYSLTAVTLEPCQLAFIEREKLLSAIKKDSDLGMELMRALGDEIISMRKVLVSPPMGPAQVR